MFYTHSDNCTPFVHIFDIIFLFAAELDEPEIGICGKWLTPLCQSIFSIVIRVLLIEAKTIIG